MKMKGIMLMLLMSLFLNAAGCSAPDGPHTDAAVTVKAGNLYELTENNFQEGLDYDFTEEELALWQNVVEQLDTAAEQKPAEEIEPGYLIRLYDEDGSEIASFSVGRDGRVYTEDNRRVEDEAIETLLRELLSGATS